MTRPIDDRDPTALGEPTAVSSTPAATRTGAPEAPAARVSRTREVTEEHGTRARAGMVFWLVVLVAVGVGVTLYFLFGREILPLLGPQP